MKIRINYDLLTKVEESNQGYSLKRCIKKTLTLASISTTLLTLPNLSNTNLFAILSNSSVCIGLHALYNIPEIFFLKKLIKINAITDLSKLERTLNNAGVRVDLESLMHSYQYDKEYSVNAEEKNIPIIEQKKYIKIPIKDEICGDKEIPLIQEHLVGTKDYYLSLGIKQEKVYKLGSRFLERGNIR